MILRIEANIIQSLNLMIVKSSGFERIQQEIGEARNARNPADYMKIQQIIALSNTRKKTRRKSSGKPKIRWILSCQTGPSTSTNFFLTTNLTWPKLTYIVSKFAEDRDAMGCKIAEDDYQENVSHNYS